MPLAIGDSLPPELRPQLDDALEIVCNEFDGLDPHQQYHNAFSRVLKPDPLGRVLMMGTDQRDLFAKREFAARQQLFANTQRAQAVILNGLQALAHVAAFRMASPAAVA